MVTEALSHLRPHWKTKAAIRIKLSSTLLILSSFILDKGSSPCCSGEEALFVVNMGTPPPLPPNNINTALSGALNVSEMFSDTHWTVHQCIGASWYRRRWKLDFLRIWEINETGKWVWGCRAPVDAVGISLQWPAERPPQLTRSL